MKDLRIIAFHQDKPVDLSVPVPEVTDLSGTIRCRRDDEVEPYVYEPSSGTVKLLKPEDQLRY